MRKRTMTLFAATIMLATFSTGVQGQTPARPASGQVQIAAAEMCCKGCAQKVSGQLYTVKGVKSVGVDLAAHKVTVSLPQQDPAILGALWHAVQKGGGGPTRLVTESATYALVLPKSAEEAELLRGLGTTQHIVIENLHGTNRAQQIADKLSAIQGVAKVSVDLERDALVLETERETPISPWLTIGAVAEAGDRASSVSGNFGTLSIEYAAAPAPNNNQAFHTNHGGIQK